MGRKKRLPWRVQSGQEGDFDEIVVGGQGGPMILHAEMLDYNSCFIDVAGLMLWVFVKDGVAMISNAEDNRTENARDVTFLRDIRLDQDEYGRLRKRITTPPARRAGKRREKRG